MNIEQLTPSFNPDQPLREPLPSAESTKKSDQPAALEQDPVKKKLMQALLEAGALRMENGSYIFDENKFESSSLVHSITEQKKSPYLAKIDGKNVLFSFKLITEKLGDLPVKIDGASQDLVEKNTVPLGSIGRFARITELQKPVKDQLLAFLEKEKITEMADGHLIFDLNKLTDPGFREKIHSTFIKINGKSRNGTLLSLVESLGSMPVVSKEDYDNSLKSDTPTKELPLFNIPKSVDELTDPEKIRNKEYYLNPWEVYNPAVSPNFWNHKIHLNEDKDTTMTELGVATKLFREYRAHRDEKGNLLVYDEDRRDFHPITHEWLISNAISSGIFQKKSIHRALLSDYPNLIQGGLLRLSDFQIHTGKPSGELLRKEVTMKDGTAQIMLNGAQYYIAKDNFIFDGETIPKEKIKIIILDQNTAGIIKMDKGQERLIFTLDLLTQEEKEAKRAQVISKHGPGLKTSNITARTLVSKREVDSRLSRWRVTADNPKRDDETPEDYAERIKELQNISYIKKVSADFSEKCGLGIHNLNWREQQWLAGAAYSLGNEYPKLLEFGKKFDLFGLKTFLSCEQNLSMAEKILSIGEKLEQTSGGTVFSKFGELIDLAEKENLALAESFYGQGAGHEPEMRRVKLELLRKAHRQIDSFGQKLTRTRGGQQQTQSLIDELQNDKAEISLLASVLKITKEEGGLINLDEIKNLELEKREMQKSDELSSEEKEELLNICMHNYREVFKNNPQALMRVVSSFKAELENLADQTVFILKFQGQIVAFCRFKPAAEDEVYAGSLNVVKDVQGLSIGNYFIANSINEMAKNYKIQATTRKDNPANGNYQKQGFVFTREFREDDGVEYYEMEMDKRVELKKAA